MLTVQILQQAEAELFDAATYYVGKSPGLGSDFLDEMEEAIEAIQEAPFRQPERDDRTRRFLTKRFPYQIIYTIYAETIWIIAFSNQRQRPAYWRDRI
jgi:toxin ParE1/3/4